MRGCGGRGRAAARPLGPPRLNQKGAILSLTEPSRIPGGRGHARPAAGACPGSRAPGAACAEAPAGCLRPRQALAGKGPARLPAVSAAGGWGWGLGEVLGRAPTLRPRTQSLTPHVRARASARTHTHITRTQTLLGVRVQVRVLGILGRGAYPAWNALVEGVLQARPPLCYNHIIKYI